jgi:Cu+-exporting ATPase
MQSSPTTETAEAGARQNAAVTELSISGMTCQNCARHVTEAIQSVPGVRSATVSLENKNATVRWNAGAEPDVPAVIAAVKQAGYEAKAIEAGAMELLVTGMTCANCARHVTEAIQSVPAVRSAAVSLEAGRATVRWRPGAPRDLPAVLTAIAAAGYQAKPAEPAQDHSEHHRSRWQWNLILGVAVTAALMLGDWVFQLATAPWFRWLSFALAGAVQVFAGAQFYRGAWRQLKIGSSNMDTLVALGSTTAFGYSAWALLSGAGGHLYFMEAAAIITLISLGHWLEARVSDQAGSALKSLMQLAPQTARKISSSRREEAPSKFDIRHSSFGIGQSLLTSAAANEIEVPVSELCPGDRVALRPGDRVPVDGVVMEGESAVDEAMLTGESVPVDKKSGSELFAGTVNLNGRLVMRVTATGEGTALAHVIAAVQRAQTSRADIQRLGDRVSSIFVPVVVAIAIAAGLWWGLAPESAGKIHGVLEQFIWHSHAPVGVAAGFIIAAAVLIVACPCAMGLATPAAIMASANAAARRGILIRDGVALEKAGRITAVVFDKTGTLTVGKPEVAQILKVGCPDSPHPNPLPWGEGTAKNAFEHSSDSRFSERLTTILPLPAGEGRGEGNEITRMAATLARHSTHPVSQAITKISADEVAITDWKEICGRGVEAKSAIGNRQSAIVRLGSLRWLRELGVDLAAGEKFISEWSGQGATIVGLASENHLLGLFAVRDAIKTNARQVVDQLQRQGLEIFLVTGDNSLTAAGIARQVGIAAENVFAEVRPEQKAEFVKKLQSGGGTGVPPVRSKTETHGQDASATMRVAFVGDGINDAPALTQADLGIAVSRASDLAREAADIILLKSEIEAVPEALGLARATLWTIKQNLFWAFFYNALGVPLAALGFISPILCAAAMGFSDLIVIGNALRLLRWRA